MNKWFHCMMLEGNSRLVCPQRLVKEDYCAILLLSFPTVSPNHFSPILTALSSPTTGLSATISPVLYANMVHPEFKEKYPDWTERAKQIMKIWRRIPTEERAPFLAKARENRAQRRMDKSQKQVSEVRSVICNVKCNFPF